MYPGPGPFLSCPFSLLDWVGVLWPQLSKVLKPVRWVSSVPFPPVSMQRQVVYLLLRPVFKCSSQRERGGEREREGGGERERTRTRSRNFNTQG